MDVTECFSPTNIFPLVFLLTKIVLHQHIPSSQVHTEDNVRKSAGRRARPAPTASSQHLHPPQNLPSIAPQSEPAVRQSPTDSSPRSQDKRSRGTGGVPAEVGWGSGGVSVAALEG